MGNYNPDHPYVLGMQWAPLVTDPVTLDTGTEVGYTFRLLRAYDATQQGIQVARLLSTVPPPGRPTRKELVATLYPADKVAGTGPIRKMVVPCRDGSLQTGATLQGGAGAVVTAVANPSSAGYVQLSGANSFCRFWFNTLNSQVEHALQWRRILDVSVLYAVSGPFDANPNAMNLGLERPSASIYWIMDATLTGAAAATGNIVVRRSRLGDLNPWWSSDSAKAPTVSPVRYPWRWDVDDGLGALAVSGGTNINVRIGTGGNVPAGTLFGIHYVALEITYCEENRLGGGGLDISAGAALLENIYAYDIPLLGVGQAYGSDIDWLTVNKEYAITVGQAYSGQQSVTSPVPVTVDRLGSVEPFAEHRGVVLRKTLRAGSTPSLETVPAIPSITLYGAVSPSGPTTDISSHPYTTQRIATAYSRYGFGASTQHIPDDVAGEYVWIRFYARHLPGTDAPLRIAQVDLADASILLGPYAEISVEEFDRLPELVNGWKEVTLRLSPAAVMSGSGALTQWSIHSSANDASPWQVVGADANPQWLDSATTKEATYGGGTAFAEFDAGFWDPSADMTVMLAREMDLVTGLTLTPAVQPLSLVDDDCGLPVEAIPTGIRYHRLSWDVINSGVVAGWGYYEVQRQDDTMPAGEWETIAKVPVPQVAAVDDYEARVGVASRYRVRMVHRTGFEGPWSSVVAGTIPAPGVTGARVDVGVLIFTSNHNPAGNLAYVNSFERNPEEQFAWPEGEQTELQEMYGRDYRVAFRPTERAGTEFTRTLLINAAGVPPQTMDKGFTGLRDLAWDTVPYVCVRDELHNRWLSTLLVPSGTVRRVPGKGHLELARVTVVEVTDTPAPVDGGDPPCEGLRTSPTEAHPEITAPTPAALFAGPVAVSDTFNGRTVPPGGWESTETPGLPWLVHDGNLNALSVDGGVGQIAWVKPGNSNPYFNTDVSGWTVQGGTVAWHTAVKHEGVGSAQVIPSGSAATVRLESDRPPAAQGQTWKGTAWVRCAVGRTVIPEIRWYDSAGTIVLSVPGPGVSVAAGVWTPLSITVNAVNALTASVAFAVAMDGTPLASHLLNIDEAAVYQEPKQLRMSTDPELTDVVVRARVRTDALATGGGLNVFVLGRYANLDNHYRGRLVFEADGRLQIAVEKVSGGVTTTLGALTPVKDDNNVNVPHVVGQWYWLELACRGAMIRASAWKDGALDSPHRVGAPDPTPLEPGRSGLMTTVGASNTNFDATLDVNEFTATTPASDLDIRVELRPTDPNWSLALVHYSRGGPPGNPAPNNSAGWTFGVADHTVYMEIFGPDVFYDTVSNVKDLVVLHQRRWVRVTYDLDGGAGGNARAVFYTSADGVVWTQTGAIEDLPEPPSLEPGDFELLLSPGVTVMRAEMRLGIDGTVVCSPNFEEHTTASTFVDAQGNTWTLSGRGVICG